MELDANSLPADHLLEGDLCVIGAGPAGLAFAHQFVGQDTRLIVVDSGGRSAKPIAQRLSEGTTTGDPYSALERTRFRGVGGTARIWNTPIGRDDGAKYVPLDAIDFEARPELSLPGWPIDRTVLEPTYHRAHQLCGLGDFEYAVDPKDVWPSADHGAIAQRFYRWGSGRIFTQTLPDTLAAAANITLVSHATVTRLITDSSGTRIEAAEAFAMTHRRLRIRAGAFVLAAGGIENARVLLLPSTKHPGGIGNHHDHVGRGFMEHPRDYSMIVLPEHATAYIQAAFCDRREDPTRGTTLGRIGFTREFLLRENLLNASVTIFPMLATRRARIRAAIGSVAPWVIPRSRGAGGRVTPDSSRRDYPRAPYGWSRLAWQPSRFAGLRLLLNLEQAANAENRVTLASRKDPFGFPLAAVHWQWREADQRNLDRLRMALRHQLALAGFGRTEITQALRPDPNAHHHSGTTRMHRDARHGVVDENGRVHSIENLFVTGSSVFPSTGFANPTLTVVALALRLADHIKQR